MKNKKALLLIIGIFIATGFILLAMGRTPICTCGYIKLWEGNNWSPGNSQHLSDWYTFSHIIHGFIFYYIIRKIAPKLSPTTQLCIVLVVEGLWEIAENSPFIIERYRAATISLDYYGDSIINSLSDMVAMIVGFILAKQCSWKLIVPMAIAMELLTIYFIRDALIFNIIMLIYPLQFLKDWQQGAHM